jgi:hypothetical protein
MLLNCVDAWYRLSKDHMGIVYLSYDGAYAIMLTPGIGSKIVHKHINQYRNSTSHSVVSRQHSLLSIVVGGQQPSWSGRAARPPSLSIPAVQPGDGCHNPRSES